MDTRSIGRPTGLPDGSVEGPPDSGRRRPPVLRILPWVVIGIVMVLLAAVAVVRLIVDRPEAPGEAVTVRAVADQAVEVSEMLDVAGGVELLCEAPMDLYRMTVEATLVRWQADAGGGMPDVSAEVSDVDEGPSGSFVIRISHAVEGGSDSDQTFRVFVDSTGGRSCITGVGSEDSERQTTRFSGNGYRGATSPAPAPAP